MNESNGALDAAWREKNFIRNMKRLREDQNLSQGGLAQKMVQDGWEGFHQTTISRIEKGERPVRLSEATGIARALNAQVSDMVYPAEEMKIVQALDASVSEARAHAIAIADYIQMYMFDQLAIKDMLNQIQEIGDTDDMDETFMKWRDQIRTSAEQVLAVSYSDIIDESFAETNGEE